MADVKTELTTTEVSRALRHNASHIRRQCKAAKGAGVTLGKATMLDLADMLEAIAQHEEEWANGIRA